MECNSIDQVDLEQRQIFGIEDDYGYSHVGKYFIDNPAESVFDLEDTPTEFILFQLDQDQSVLEVDKNLPEKFLDQIKQQIFEPSDSFERVIGTWRHRARFIRSKYYLNKCLEAYIVNENGEVRKTIESEYEEDLCEDDGSSYRAYLNDDHPYKHWDLVFIESLRGELGFEKMYNSIPLVGK